MASDESGTITLPLLMNSLNSFMKAFIVSYSFIKNTDIIAQLPEEFNRICADFSQKNDCGGGCVTV